jgi:uncharacterized protein YjbJ (UPF0337 family)
MNSDRIKGAAKTAAGKVQSGVGKAVGSKLQQAKGLKKQAEGMLQERLGEEREAAKKLKNGKCC